MNTLKERTAKGLSWGFIDNIAGTGVTAIVGLFLARILTPEDFGLVGMVAIFISIGSTLMDSGFSGALIRKKEASEVDLSTVFYTNLVLSLFIYSLLYLSAPYIAQFLNNPILSKIIRYLSLSVIILSFTQVQRVILIRKIDFKTQAIISLISSLFSGIISIYLALNGYGVWSLVVLQLSKQFIVSISLWIYSRWKPKFIFSISSFKEMFSFGGKLLISSMVSLLWTEVYSFVIGKIYNPIVVGYFNRADKFKTLITSNIGQVVQRVGYPVLSSINEDVERQQRVYRKVVRLTILITSTLVFGTIGCADSLIEVLIGEKWLPSVEYLRVLLLSGLFLPLILSSVNIFNANGKSNITLRLEIIKTALAIIPIILGIILNIKALLWGLVLITIISYLIHICYVSKEIHYSIKDQIKDIVPFILFSSCMGGVVYLGGLITSDPFIALPLQLLIGFISTLICYEGIYSSEEYHELKGYILNLFRKKS